jgi:hypothetical protein
LKASEPPLFVRFPFYHAKLLLLVRETLNEGHNGIARALALNLVERLCEPEGIFLDEQIDGVGCLSSHLRPFKKAHDGHLEEVRDGEQLAGAQSISASLVFLNLLEGHVEVLGKRGLGHADGLTADAEIPSDKYIIGMGWFHAATSVGKRPHKSIILDF